MTSTTLTVVTGFHLYGPESRIRENMDSIYMKAVPDNANAAIEGGQWRRRRTGRFVVIFCIFFIKIKKTEGCTTFGLNFLWFKPPRLIHRILVNNEFLTGGKP